MIHTAGNYSFFLSYPYLPLHLFLLLTTCVVLYRQTMGVYEIVGAHTFLYRNNHATP